MCVKLFNYIFYKPVNERKNLEGV